MGRRLARLLPNTVTILTTLLCTAVCVLWIATLERPLTLTHTDSPTVSSGIRVHEGAVAIATVTFRASPPPSDPAGTLNMILSWRDHAGRHGDVLAALGYDDYDEHLGPKNILFTTGLLAFRVKFIPLAFPALGTAVVPALELYRAARRRARRRAHLCPT